MTHVGLQILESMMWRLTYVLSMHANHQDAESTLHNHTFLEHVTYNLLCPPTTRFAPLPSHRTASPTISSTIALADFLSLTTAAAFPIRNGRALSIVSSSMSSPRVSKSCSTGITPLLVSSLISAALLFSQSSM